MTPVLIAAVAVLVLATIAIFVVRRPRGQGRTADSTRLGTQSPVAPAAAKGDGLGFRVRTLFGKGLSDATWNELEDLLIKADLGPVAAVDLVARVRKDFKAGQDPVQLLRADMVAVLGEDPPLQLANGELTVVLVVGVNGAGKTTTIGKLARRLSDQGKKVSLAGSDTFRAAAGEQLEVWAERSGSHLVSQDRGADPSAVAFDAVKSSQARGSDVLIVDTAGRLHTKVPLMDELKKVKRVIEKAGGRIGETLLVLDAQTGQNGIAQARAFTEAVDVTGVILTKMDGSAKGGIVVAVREELGVPIRFIGVGEAVSDLQPFDPTAFTERLLA
ncbi:MAG: signal recognition particle-docking protein FtsY [Actinomycetota bacterium]